MGYEYVEIPTHDLYPDGTLEEFRPTELAIERSGIPALAFNWLLPRTLPIVGPQVDESRWQAYMSVVAERAASLGGSMFVLGSGYARNVPDGFPRDRAAQQYRAFACIASDAAAKHGMAVALEAINRTETNFLHTVTEAVEHARAIDRSNIGVLADAYHMHMELEPFWHLLTAAPLLRHVQVCDAGRSYPGSRGLDLWGFFAYLNHIGYDGTVSVECRWTSFGNEGGPALDFVRSASSTTGELAFAP
jgi:sugar phosphate isomerase/epimerase